MDEAIGTKIKEKVVIEKFDGAAPKPGEQKAPVETLIFEDEYVIEQHKGE
jgi:hypothetical protein